MALDNKTFFNPKSVFRGKNADGTKFTISEWEYNSIQGIGEDINLIGNFVGAFFVIMIATPLIFVISMLTYKGKVATKHLIGLVTGVYVLIDGSNDWLMSKITAIVLDIFFKVGTGNAVVHWFIIVTGASLVGLIGLIVISIVTKGALFETNDEKKNESNGIIVMGIIFALVFVSYITTKSITKGHTQYYERTL